MTEEREANNKLKVGEKLKMMRVQCDEVVVLMVLYSSDQEEYKVALTGFYWQLHSNKFWNYLKYMDVLIGKHQNT